MTADKASAPADGLVDGRDLSGETVMGMRVAAYRHPTDCPPSVNPEAWATFFRGDPPNTYAEHWSTPGAHRTDVERLFTEADVRATITRLQADLEEARGLLNEAPVLVVNREAAKRTDDREALKYAREIHPWAVRARAFLTRTEPRHG